MPCRPLALVTAEARRPLGTTPRRAAGPGDSRWRWRTRRHATPRPPPVIFSRRSEFEIRTRAAALVSSPPRRRRGGGGATPSPRPAARCGFSAGRKRRKTHRPCGWWMCFASHGPNDGANTAGKPGQNQPPRCTHRTRRQCDAFQLYYTGSGMLQACCQLHLLGGAPRSCPRRVPGAFGRRPAVHEDAEAADRVQHGPRRRRSPSSWRRAYSAGTVYPPRHCGN